jgi:hypothetical protein
MKKKRRRLPATAADGSDQLAQLREEQRKITADRAEVYRQVGDGWPDAPARLHRLDAALADVAERIRTLETPT